MLNLLPDPQVTWLHANHSLRLALFDGCQQAFGQGFVAVRVQCPVVHLPAALFQTFSKMPHGRQEKGGANFVRPDMGGFLKSLHHQNGVLFWVKPVKGAGSFVQLVAQNQHQMTRFCRLHTDHSIWRLVGILVSTSRPHRQCGLRTKRRSGARHLVGRFAFLGTASIRAIFDVSPVLGPALAPSHLAAAGHTRLARERRLVALESGLFRHQFNEL